jgi:VCBS repeat-containing protein
LLAGVVDIDGPSLSITAVGIASGGGSIVDNHDGTFSYTPAPNTNGPVVFSYTASDGTLSASSIATLNLAGVNDAPSVVNARFAVSEGGTVVLSAANIGVADPDSTSFTFTVSNITHGKFQTTANGSTWVDATVFTAADLTAGHVRFVHDGGEDAPAFSIQADDGEALNHASATVAGVVDFTNTNDAPTVSSTVTGGGTEGTGPATVHLLDFASDADPGAVLHVANLAWTDTGSGFPAGFALSPDGNSIRVDTNNLAYNTLAQGETFTAHFAYDVVDEHGASVHQTATVTVVGTNDAPTVTSAGFSVSEGGTVVLGAANIGVADPDSTSFTFTVTNLGHGTFQITSNGNIWTSANTFTTADLNAGHVRFVDDGGEGAPTFSIRANDGAAINNQSNVLAGSVSFTAVNDAPVITTANLTIQEGGTVVLGASNLAVTDPDNNSFVFTASNVSHGTFQVTADGSIWTPVTTFNTANLNAGHVRFVHDGGEDAPTFSLQANDGAGGLSNVLAGSVSFTHVNDAPVIAGPNPVTASVQEDVTQKVVGQLTSTDPDGGAPVWSVVGGTTGHPASYSFKAYELKLTDTTPGSSFDDTLATVLQNSSTYKVDVGSFGASGGAVLLDTAHAGNFITDLSTEPFVGQFATRNQTILKSDAFTLDARFGLTIPTDLREGYGIRLNSTNPGTETLELMVQAGENGSVRVRLRDIDHDANTDTTIGTVGLNGTYAADDQIVLSLAHSASTAGVTASFYIHHSNGTDSAVTTVGTDALFNNSQGITAARAQVFAYAPVTADSYITDAYGAFSIGATGAWDYALRNGTSAVQSLGKNDHITQTFNVQVADGNGGTDTRTINVTVNGSNDKPTVNAALTAAANEGEAAFTRNLLSGAADADNGETATLLVTGVTYSVDGGAASSTAPAGFSLNSTTLGVDPSNAAFAHLAPNQHTTVVVSYNVEDVNGAAVPQTETVTINGVNNAPAIAQASLAVSEGGTTVPTPASIRVTDPDSASFTFTASNVTHGSFQTTTNGAIWVPATTFTTADLAAGHVRFVHDGGEDAPTFSIQADDGAGLHNLSNVLAGTVNFTHVNDAPVVTNAGLVVAEGGTTVLSAANVGVSDPDSASFTFTVSKVSHGAFQTTTNGATWVPATTFTTADLTAGHVRFVHDGGEDAPTFSIQADDGTGANGLSNVLAGSVSFTHVNDAPVAHASLTISQGHTVTLTTADIDFVDPDSSVVTYTVSNLSHGHFEIGVGNDADETTTFTSADVAAGLVSFVDDGSSTAPAFSLTPNDGSIDGVEVQGVVTFSASNYTLTSSEGVIINVTPEGATSGFVFPGAGNVTTPGTPEDRIAIGYDVVGGPHVVLDNAPLLGVHQMTPVVSSQTHSGDTTFVSTTLDAGHGVTLVQTIALDDDANFFTTTIDITNNGTADISNLRFLRNFDPDQDVQAHGPFATFNDVVQKPDGSETFAIVSATGFQSHTTVAMVGLGAEWQGSVFGFTNTDPYALHAFDMPTDPNGALDDKSLSLTSSLGTLAAHGGHAEVTYITTNNVATAGNNALYGTVGDDTINGLGGDDLLIGLKGADTFVFNAASGGSGHDTIADFTPGQDKISLNYLAFDANDPYDFSNWLRTHATDIHNNINNNNDVLIDLNVSNHPGVDTILLKNIATVNLQAGDFILHTT